MEGEVVLSLDNQVTQVYALIYTTDTDLSDSTTIIHPAKAFAIAKRVDPPAIEDPIASHASTGAISISLEDLGGEYMERKREPYYGDKSPKVDEKVSVSLDVAPQPETRTFYHSAIQKAVQDGNIPKALGLLEEAKALNIEGAQEVFVKAVNAQ